LPGRVEQLAQVDVKLARATEWDSGLRGHARVLHPEYRTSTWYIKKVRNKSFPKTKFRRFHTAKLTSATDWCLAVGDIH